MGSGTSTDINVPSASSQMVATYLALHKVMVMTHGRSPETSTWELLRPLRLPVPQFPCLQKGVGRHHLPLPSTMRPSDVRVMDEPRWVNRGIYATFRQFCF